MDQKTEAKRITSLSDPGLADAVRARDPYALEMVVRAYLPQILRAAIGTGLNETDAEDVTQETFVTFIAKADTFEGRSHVRTWIFGILYRKILQSYRQDKKQQQMDDIDEVVEQRFRKDGQWARPPEAIDTVLHHADIRSAIEDCLEGVPTRQRMVFVLREIEHQTTSEICKILEVTATNVGALLSRARNRLRECLESKGMSGSNDASL